VAHLIREEWWRRTGEWPGDEALHGHGDDPSSTLDWTNLLATDWDRTIEPPASGRETNEDVA
jgi:hypothetical protein